MNNFVTAFKSRVKNRKARISVVGLGYVGLPLAVEFAKKGFLVSGVELDEDRISRIRQKISYISDVPTADLRKIIENGKFTAESSFRLLREADVILICVPTPLKRKYSPDISYIKDAVEGISRNLKKNTLVILESTTYPGTTEEVIMPILESSGLKHGKDFYLVFSPERIDPGNEKFPLNKIPKVVGGINSDATQMAAEVYSSIIDKVVPVSSARVAETVKLLENTFRLINIGLIDEMAMMANKMNIDIWEVVSAASTKPFGFMPFYPGPGVGGHCIPKDPLYLYWKAKRFGFNSRFIKLASDVISNMPGYVVKRTEEALKKKKIRLPQAKILVMGVTYKKDIKDLRKSPALDIINILIKEKADVSYFDPLVPYLKIDGIDLKSVKLSKTYLRKMDCVIIASDHSGINYKQLLQNSRMIFDSRNVYGKICDRKVIRL